MDLNAKINWKSGMPLTPGALSAIEEGQNRRRMATMRSSFFGAWGVLPGCKPVCTAMFVDGKIEVKVQDCTALLPSGGILDLDGESSFTVGRLADGLWYLCAGFGEGTVAFEKEGVPYERPEYAFGIATLDEIGERLPLLRLRVGDGNVSIDKDFILPSLSLSSDVRYGEWAAKIAGALHAVATHAHLEEGEKKRSLLRYHFLCGGYKAETSLIAYVRFIGEVCQAVQYYVMPEQNAPDSFSVMDPELYLSACLHYLEEAAKVLDNTAPEDHSIDIEALKEQIRSELYERLSTEFKEEMDKRFAAMGEDLGKRLEQTLRGFIEGEFKTALSEALRAELEEKLGKELYDKLYTALYNALFVPEKVEEDNYMPVI